MKFEKTFITTTLPYVNSKPHIGHLFEFILADSLTRFLKHNGKEVYFNTGIDEHGVKVYTKSIELNKNISDYLSDLNNVWIDFCQKFNIKYDNFYRTSDKSHHEKVKIIWNRFLERGDIYKKNYKGKYCVGCESFKLDKDTIDGKCTDHPTTNLVDVDEENYFFKLTNYKSSLLNWINNNPDFLEPKSKLDELKYLINNSEDISISRLKENCPWGVEVPNDVNHVIYVWFDALLNYIFAAGYLTDNFNWDNVIQLCGPDNLRFQAIIFQSFLESEKIKKSDKLLVHGTILDKDGKKISKSLGNVIDPIEELGKYGYEPIRYYSLTGLSTYSDSNWNSNDLVAIWNNEVCNDWGNLLSRTLHLIDIKLNGNLVEVESDFKIKVDDDVTLVKEHWNNYHFRDALVKTNEIVKFANKYINDVKPWSAENPNSSLSNLYYLIKEVNELYYSVLPDKYNEVKTAIEQKKKAIIFNKIENENISL